MCTCALEFWLAMCCPVQIPVLTCVAAAGRSPSCATSVRDNQDLTSGPRTADCAQAALALNSTQPSACTVGATGPMIAGLSCTNLQVNGTCAVSLCGPPDSSIACTDAASAIIDIVYTCGTSDGISLGSQTTDQTIGLFVKIGSHNNTLFG